MRLFIAIVPDNETAGRIAELRDEVRNESLRGSFVPSSNIHLTLEFLGECTREEMMKASSVLGSLSFSPFTVTLDRTGAFRHKDGDVIFIGAEHSPELMNLHNQLERRLRENGFRLERRKYTPHVTLARRAVSTYMTGRIEKIRFRVCSVCLMLSERTERGMVYSVLHEVEGFARNET